MILLMKYTAGQNINVHAANVGCREMKMRFLGRTCLIVLSLLPAVSTQGSTVVGFDQPIIASPGEDVTLPCHITPRLSAVDMVVRWYRESFINLVHLYEDRRDRTDDQDSDYRGRTALSRLELQEGILSLNLRNLRPSDSGVYSCYATDGVWGGQGKTELIVRALGTQPSISVDSTQGEQTRLVCRSEGWSPEPEVIWRDRDGNDVMSLSSTTVQRDSQGFLSVSSYIKIKQQSNVFSCLVRSKIPKPDWESKLHISSDFFPGVSGWMVAFFLTLALSIGAIPLLVIQWRRMDAMDKKLEPMAAQHLREELESVKRKVLKSEWKWILSSAVESLTLDLDTAHPQLTLPVNKKQGRRKRQDHNSQRFDYRRCVLGREGFTSGRHYWELGLGENTFWRLGVSRQSAPRKEEFSMNPQQGYWTLGWDGDKDEFTALTDPQTPLPWCLKSQKLGMYLDYEEGQLSFYNVETKSHIYTFTDMEFNPNEKLHPFFWTSEYKDLVLVSPGKMNDSSFFLLVWKGIIASSVDVTLDPDTVYPELILAAEGKRVRWGKTRQRLPNNPKRFDGRRCVLGMEGFTSGRRYWQVLVGGNTDWRLGVSRESAERNGKFSMTPQQGYWTVEWSGYVFTALTDPQTILPLSLKPQKLGVYLDYEEGQLSFYNVETRSHIYTFTDMEFNPSEKLYPFFWTWDEKTDLVLESPDPDSAAD
ncbi:butyrophilin subfamily 2 member A2-like isoform X2 [Acipenser ruthenus]|uniref:butyrophilin subfamily 2 member A2-like isoform X2 n=2 Tax=Acipenser ruthenus TaxID=7906 RepID=UPI002740D78C|nr:butyrophilin subfamily 2 member A2-like isoform X2 [Acipenser ruthenus]